ncbi:MAG TPA: hypothetical protein VFT45_12380 [Longimicrobium sp.]|nr:hypothetical protein [Longimicrobium sp.]
MRKLTLTLEALDVQSFPTTEAGGNGRGTVRGRETGATCPDADSCWNSCECSYQDTCNQPQITCYQSCLGSCASCPVSCNPAQCPSADGRC